MDKMDNGHFGRFLKNLLLFLAFFQKLVTSQVKPESTTMKYYHHPPVVINIAPHRGFLLQNVKSSNVKSSNA